MITRRVKSHAITIAEDLPTSTGTATNCRNGTSSVLAVHPGEDTTVCAKHLRLEITPGSTRPTDLTISF